jgi:prepilin-type N-terminal cleavage/methylation domain-containing protein
MPRPPSPARTRARRASRGYTAVEVLMAMTVMAIGAAAVISMQKTAILGNLDARKGDVASSIARTWIERLQRDSMQWTLPSPTNANSNMANAKLLNGHVTGKWFLPVDYMGVTTPETMSPAFDILGRDLATADMGSAVFCANVRLTFLSPDNLLIRADVRVLWARSISNAPPAGGFCNATIGTQDIPDPLTYHSIFATTSIMENAAP